MDLLDAKLAFTDEMAMTLLRCFYRSVFQILSAKYFKEGKLICAVFVLSVSFAKYALKKKNS